MIEVLGLSYRYEDGTAALDGLSLRVAAGERLCVLGRNGAGKSTLFYHLNGLYLAQRGEVRVLGERVTAASAGRVRQRVGLVFQDPDDQVIAPTVAEDVAFGPRNQQLPPAEVEQRVAAALAQVGLAELGHKAPHNLSYGQKKRVAIAGVLAMRPEILLLDEPMAFLDPEGQQSLEQVLTGLSAAGKTLVVATHDVDFAAAFADRVLILAAGRVMAAGPPDLLCDADLASRAGLRLPLVAELFRELLPAGAALPRSIAAGRELIRRMGGF